MTEFKNMLKNEDFHTVIINELREIGVKYKEKKCKLSQEKECQKKVFQTPLHMLEVANVILCDGSAVLVPKFLADACNRILQNVEAEGIFRKAGSSLRQKEIRNGLEAGLPINRTQHVIDIANVLKYFFRELPEPLIPQSLHEPLLRAMMLGANNLKAILLICLLVPQLTLNTLSFFMQFLKTVASNSDSNKMTSGNLAIIFAPGIMPYSDIRSPRFNNHVKLVQMLIDNANMIGSIPPDIIKKFQQCEILQNGGSPTKICRTIDITQKKKKNRRSEMFSGIRKIVESALGSAENLDESFEKIKLGNSETFTNPVQNIIQRKNEHMLHGTPCTKSSKKRKFPDTSTAFSVRKNLLPSNSGGLFPTTPFTKDYKKTRSSLCGNRQPRNDIVNPEGSSMERRWSFVGSGWNKLKPKHGPAKNGLDCTDGDFHTSSKNIFRHDVINEKVISSYFAVNNKPHNINGQLNQNRNGEFSTLSQNDFDDITERVQAIENRITKEFEKLRESLNSKTEMLNYSHNSVINAESVQNKYERIKTETVPLCSPSTDLLAKRLSRDLNIRKSIDKKILRSPSARKIGTLRKRSQESSKISRNKSWHTNSKSLHLVKTKIHVSKDNDLNNALDLKIMSPALLINDQKSRFLETKFDTSPTFGNENWTSADIFFKGKQEQKGTSNSEKTQFVYKTPQKQKLYSNPSALISTNCPPTTVFHTPMLPPKSISHRTSQRNSEIKSNSNTSNTVFAKKSLMYTPFEEDGSGRASIARLRTQNAGMVMAKAKLFDDMGNESADNSLKGTSTLKESSSSIRSGSGPFVFMPASRKNEKVQQTVKNGCNSSTLNVQKNRKKLPGTKTKEEKRSTIVKRNLAVSPGFVKKDRCSAQRMTNKQLVSFLTTNEK